MKFSFAIIASALALVSAKKTNNIKPVEVDSTISSDSQLGRKLLSKARRMNDNQEVDYSWLTGYSLKFQGCHATTQWNAEANGEDEPFIMTKRLIRFRLCPSAYCSAESGAGCSDNYGDYIIDMNIFLEAYIENKQQTEEYMCEYVINNECNCEDGDDKGDDFNKDYCEYDCYKDRNMDYCIERNPYEDDQQQQQQQEEFNIEEYMECGQWKANNNRRNLNDEEVKYYIGPYCSDSGGKIYLGLFTDETCSTFADDYGGTDTYTTLSGSDLPYSKETLIGMDCFSCMEPKEMNDQNQNDQQDEDEVKEVCTELYKQSGKCEPYLGQAYENDNACTFIEGIQITRKNASVMNLESKNKVAGAFVGIFAVSFCLLGAYVYYLKNKLDRAKINLSD